MRVRACVRGMSKEHTRVVHGRESVSVFPVCNTCEIHPTQIEKQLLDHEGCKCMSQCESLIWVFIGFIMSMCLPVLHPKSHNFTEC